MPARRIAAAAIHTFADYLVFHPHLHVFAINGLFGRPLPLHARGKPSHVTDTLQRV
jgi:hypothetical protein